MFGKRDSKEALRKALGCFHAVLKYTNGEQSYNGFDKLSMNREISLEKFKAEHQEHCRALVPATHSAMQLPFFGR